MATFTQAGSILNQPAQMTSSTNANMSAVLSTYTDDDYVGVTLPFTFQFYENQINTWFVGTNSYITKTGQTSYSPTPSMDVGIYVSASDNSCDYIGSLTSSDGNSVTIHFEGNNSYNDGSHNLVWDVTFFRDGVIQVVTDPYNFVPFSSSFSCLSDKVTSTELDFSPVANQSYVFIPNSDFSGYTGQLGVSYSYSQVAVTNNYIPDVPTNLRCDIGNNITFYGTVNDRDGGTAKLSVDYSTDINFSTYTTVESSGFVTVGTTASIAVNSFTSSTLYYWRARAYDGTNYSSYSSVMSFTSPDFSPPVASNLLPASQTKTNSSSITLSAVITSPNGVNIQGSFQISTDSTFNTGVQTSTTTSVPSGSTVSSTGITLTSNSMKSVILFSVLELSDSCVF